MKMKKYALLLIMLATTIGAFAAREVGGDISLLSRYEANGARYLNQNGGLVSGDKLLYLKEQGWSSMRVRLFVDPSKASNADKGQGVCQDLPYVIALGKRIKQAGLTFMLDFHYSDSWADPVKQFTPAAWVGLNDEQLYQKIYDYTRDCLEQLVAAGATPDYIQTGNEISYGMLWGPEGGTLLKCYTSNNANWARFTTLLANAGRACREVCPKAKIVIHTERVPNIGVLTAFYDRMNAASLDYDIIGLSYYPYFHRQLSQLQSALAQLQTKYPDKKVMIVETGYYHAYQPDNVTFDYSATYPITPAGQLAFTQDMIKAVKAYKNVIGIYWWWPEANEYGLNWSTKRVTDAWYNAGLWDNSTGRAMPALYALKDYLPAAGDINDDTTVDITDLNLLINQLLAVDDPYNFPGSGDMNRDGKIDITDLNVLINQILGQ